MIQLIRGFKDILPGEIETWQKIEKTAIGLLEAFGFFEIRLPIMEKTELFARSIGQDTDIVEKEMYTFADRKGQMLTLRPEATASIVRSYIQHRMYASDPVRRLYTIGPMFRRERPQKGRYRQFYQIDAEIFGVAEPYVDAELIFILATLCHRLGVKDISAHVNSLGCPECRPAFRKTLMDFLGKVAGSLCSDCLRRRKRNPLRILDCKVPGCRQAVEQAPSLADSLCGDCRRHFDTVCGLLADRGISFNVNKNLVRGLDYYTRTAFELQTGALGAQSAVAGGGRYDGLVKALGGPAIPAIGFAIGFDRLAEIVAQVQQPGKSAPPVFIAALGNRARDLAFQWHLDLAREGIATAMEFSQRSLKAQMKKADRLKAGYVLIVGDNELESGRLILRNMQTQKQEEVVLNEAVAFLAGRFNRADKKII